MTYPLTYYSTTHFRNVTACESCKALFRAFVKSWNEATPQKHPSFASCEFENVTKSRSSNLSSSCSTRSSDQKLLWCVQRSSAGVSVFSTTSNQPWALMTDRARHRSSSTVVLAFTTVWLQKFWANATSMSMHTRTCTSTSWSTKIAIRTIYVLCASLILASKYSSNSCW